MCYTVKSIDDVRSLVVATRGLSGLTDLRTLSAKACRRMHELTGADLSVLALLRDDETLEIVATSGIDIPLAGVQVSDRDGIGQRCLDRKMPVTTGNCTELADSDAMAAVAAAAGMRGFAAVPLLVDDHRLGVLFAGQRDSRVRPRVTLLLGEFSASLAPLVATARRAQNAGTEAVEAERQRIAQDLHDTAGQLLFKISMSARELVFAAHEADDVLDLARGIETDAAEASAYLRQAMGRLMPTGDALPVTIRRDVETFGARTGIATELAVFGAPHAGTPALEGVLVAVVREALHNVEKHAGADAVFVSLSYRHDGIGLVVEDDGKGLPADFSLNPVPGRSGGLGLSALWQKTAGLAGTLEIGGNDDGGTTLRVAVPWGGR